MQPHATEKRLEQLEPRIWGMIRWEEQFQVESIWIWMAEVLGASNFALDIDAYGKYTYNEEGEKESQGDTLIGWDCVIWSAKTSVYLRITMSNSNLLVSDSNLKDKGNQTRTL